MEEEERQLEWEVTELLRRLGTSPHRKADRSFRTALLLTAREPELLAGSMKELYARVSVETGHSPETVKGHIRSTTLRVWQGGPMAFWKYEARMWIPPDGSTPSPQMIFTALAAYVRRWIL